MEASKAIASFLVLCIFLALFYWQKFHQEAILSILAKERQELSTIIAHDRASSPPLHPFLQQYAHTLRHSDFVELDHCSLKTLNWTDFQSWAGPILMGKARQKASPPIKNFDNETATTIHQEWILELLEIYATHSGLCDFENYRFHIQKKPEERMLQAGKQLQHVVSESNGYSVPAQHARIAFAIVAFQDAQQLKRLIDAIYMPHHIIVIHLEEDTDASFQTKVDRIIKPYPNIVVARFGTIVYKTDSVTRVNLQIMNWLVNDLQLPYDYHVTLGGAAYPLHGASELAQKLYKSSTDVWLGELTHKGQLVHHEQWGFLWRKRLVATSSKAQAKLGFLFEAPPPTWIINAMQHKSASGNQAVYSRSVVQQILVHPQVLELFALAKYGCCCCIEERIWIAALDTLGYLEEAKSNKGMFQLWGGDSDQCRGSMQNAVLDLDDTRCYRSENPKDGDLYIYGNETWDRLVAAKDEGVLFARKFHSSHSGSVQLLSQIREHMHGANTIPTVGNT